MVLDTSAILAIVFHEARAPFILAQIRSAPGPLAMSTVNLAETLILLEDRKPKQFEELKAQVLALPLQFIAPSTEAATIAAEARSRFPLNLGDCFAYALAKQLGTPILTLDRDFRKSDVPVILPPARD
jgi:ribonuclease VapC